MFILAFVSLAAYAQSLTVTGKVIDSEGYEVIGSSVTIKGVAGVGTVTDVNGNYTLKVNDASKDVLVFSYVGMTPQEVKVNNRSVINVTLQADAVLLEDVVVIGYAAVPRRDLTGSVTSVSSKELSKVPVSDVTQALTGRMAGVMVQQSEGTPGASISVRVRGGISITQSNEPLYIIDGFPSEDGMSTLDPAEIETIDVLKDASATAIYGARGANGVVVITTKNGSKSGGKATVTFDSYVGVKKIANKLDVLNAGEFARLDYERTLWRMGTGDSGADGMTKWEERYGKFSDLASIYNGRKGIDWQDETLGRNAITQNYRVGVSGKTEKMNYSLAYSYYNEEGAMVYSGSKKHNISFNMNHEINKWLTVNSRISYDQMRVEGMGTSEGGDRFNKMQHILQYRPTVGIMGVDEDLLYGEDPLLADDNGNVMQNPLISAAEELNDREWRTFQANGGATIKLLKGLSFRSTVGMRYQTRRNDVFYGDESITGKRSSIQGSITNLENSSFQTSNVLTYSWKNKIHDFTVIAGHEYVERWSRSFSASASQFPNDEIGLGDLSLGVPGVPTSSENYDDKLLSFFGRINYNLMDKYLFTASVRADGSSKFGKNNKWGYFPAFSAAWRLSEEEFIKDLGIFSDLKFRIGYGLAGNNRIGSYQSLALMNSVTAANGNGAQAGYASRQVPNPDLKWEKTGQFDVGFNLGLFNNRLNFDIAYYNKKTTDLLLDCPVPHSTGFTSIFKNIGSVCNQGVDIMVNGAPIQGDDFTWSSTLNLNYNKNEILALSDTNADVYLYDWVGGGSVLRVGESMGSFWGLERKGVYTLEDYKAGACEKTQIGRAKRSDEKTIIGKGLPDWTGSWINNFSYKNFDLTVDLQFVWGVETLQRFMCTTNDRFGITNGLKGVLYDAYDGTNPETMQPMIYLASGAHFGEEHAGQDITSDSGWVANGSYLRCNMVQLGYTFNSQLIKKIGLSGLRLYASGNNLFQIVSKDFLGYDPESSSETSGKFGQNMTFFSYPRARTFTLGVNVTF